MPTAPARPCLHPGCPALVIGGSRCPTHAAHNPARHYDARRRNDDLVKVRRGGNWRKVSLLVRARQPVCVDPFGDHAHGPEPSAEVHHIESAHSRPDLVFAMENLAAVCVRCHALLSAMERRGERTAHLFASL